MSTQTPVKDRAVPAPQATDDPYHSRAGTDWSVDPRPDPVLWSDSPRGPLSSDELARYDTQGYWFHPELISQQEAQQLLVEAEQLARDVDRHQPGVISEPDSDVVRSVFRVHRIHSSFRRLCQDARLVDVARQLLGSDVYIHQSRINFKPAFNGKEFFWHSDFETWHIEDGMPRPRAVSISVNLTANTEFNGPLIVVPGSHRHYVRCVGLTPENHFEKSLKKQEYGVPDRAALAKLVEQGGMVAPKGEPGSATLFESNLMHGSVGNLSPFPRTNVFIVFNSIENALVDPFGGRRPRPDFLAERDVIPVDELS